MSCKAAISCDQYHGWECEISGGECMFLIPDSIACALVYGEGPDSEKTKDELEQMIDQSEMYQLSKRMKEREAVQAAMDEDDYYDDYYDEEV